MLLSISMGGQNLQKMHQMTLPLIKKDILCAGQDIKCAPGETIRSNRHINTAARWNAAGSFPAPMKRNVPKEVMAGRFTSSTTPISVFIHVSPGILPYTKKPIVNEPPANGWMTGFSTITAYSTWKSEGRIISLFEWCWLVSASIWMPDIKPGV